MTNIKSTINELDDLFGTIEIKSNEQSNSLINTNENSLMIQSQINSSIDTNLRKTSLSSFSFQDLFDFHSIKNFFSFFFSDQNSNELLKKKTTLFEDLKDLLVDHSTGIKILSSTTTTKRFQKKKLFLISLKREKKRVLIIIQIKQKISFHRLIEIIYFFI